MTEDLFEGPVTGVQQRVAPWERLTHVLENVDALVRVTWHEYGDEQIAGAIATLEQVQRRILHVQSELIGAAEGRNAWVGDGFRSVTSWLQALTGATRSSAHRHVRLSRALSSDLPFAAKALAEGRMGYEHAAILQREATRTDRLREQLCDGEMGEEFLVGLAQKLNADDYRKAVKHWAVLGDPDAADRNWRQESEHEEVFLSAVGDSYYLSGRLNKTSGRALETALNAQMGRRTAGDSRSPANRRAAALVSWAHSWLDSGALKPGSRIRPHLTVHVPFQTLQALCEATGSAVPPQREPMLSTARFPSVVAPGMSSAKGEAGCVSQAQIRSVFDEGAWVKSWKAGDDHVIATELDYSRLRGVPPATMEDGTALPPSVLGRLACSSSLTRVVFGPESTIIDVGREQRIFPANQTKAIIARDRHCQYPSCSEPPEFGEIHHSLWWWKHNGKTSTDQGILLCWHHHAYVHEKHISIARIDGEWVFFSQEGNVIAGIPSRKLS